MARRKKPSTPITARDIEVLTRHRDELDAREAVLKDPQFQELWAYYTQLSPEGQQAVERRARFLANSHTGRVKVVIDNTRTPGAGGAQ
jgi:hypothetical protein